MKALLYKLLFCMQFLIAASCGGQLSQTNDLSLPMPRAQTVEEKYLLLFDENPSFKSDGFDYPVAPPHAKGYYNAQGFGVNRHLGDDWNAKTGGNSDLGHPIYSIANGYVSEVEDFKGGWGNVVRIVHSVNGQLVESLYAHCQDVFVKKDQWIKRGDKIATIGNNNGMYWAHLHLELRDAPALPLGGGYSLDTAGYLNPASFIEAHRPKR